MENCRGLGVVAVETVEDGVDMWRASFALVESRRHGELLHDHEKVEWRRRVKVDSYVWFLSLPSQGAGVFVEDFCHSQLSCADVEAIG